MPLDESLILDNVGEYTEEAVTWLREELADKGKIYVAFSGGKDSIVTAGLLRLAGIDHQLYYNNTTIEPPAVMKFIRKEYPECIWLRPKHSFFKQIVKMNPPLRGAKWCCFHMKKIPGWRIKIDQRVLGIRWEESTFRKSLDRKELVNTGTFRSYYKRDQNHTHYYPIFYWPSWAIWEFIEEQKLEVPHLYDTFDRLGCVVCPMRKRANMEKWRKIYPKHYEAFEKACATWYDLRTAQGRTMAYSCVEAFLEAWYSHKVSWYDKEFRDLKKEDNNE